MNEITINGVYNTTKMQGVPQNADSAGLVLFIVRKLQEDGYRGVRVSTGDGAIYYKTAPENVLKSAPGFYVQAHGQETADYVRLLQDE
jgi:hypothetical protein